MRGIGTTKKQSNNAICIPWPTTIEIILLKALEVDCQWLILQENGKTVGYINRATLHKKVKELGFEKILTLSIEEIITQPVDNEYEDSLYKNNRYYSTQDINRQFGWHLGQNISDYVASDEWISKELEAIFCNFLENILITDGYGNIVFASAEDDQQYLNKNVFDLERQKEFYPSVTAKVLNTGERQSGLQYTKTGEVFTIESIPIQDNYGRIVRVVSITKDSSQISELNMTLSEVKSLLVSYQQDIVKSDSSSTGQKPFIFKSQKMQAIYQLIQSIAPLDSTVLILGETGVGKEVIASTIHHLSSRSTQPFVAVNCGAIPENLIEAELFGYESGAFSGAKKEGKIGLFELANKGTIFLDELGELPLHLQVKLLRVLQEKKIQRVGGTKEIPVDMRIIAATNQSLEQRVQEKTFRADLYYRLNVVPIHIPPLRERKEDIEVLAKYYLQRFNDKYYRNAELNELILERLKRYEWPGNVRELQNVMERYAITNQELFSSAPLSVTQPEEAKNKELPKLIDFVEKAEQEILMEAKAKTKNTREMAKLLGVNQSTIVRKLNKYNL